MVWQVCKGFICLLHDTDLFLGKSKGIKNIRCELLAEMTDNKEKNRPKTSFLEKEKKSRSEARIT